MNISFYFSFYHFPMLFNENLRSLGGGETNEHRWTDGHMEIHPCVLQEIGPLGPLPKNERFGCSCVCGEGWVEVDV